jgi:N-acetylmuramoyl-L-alanine amidase
MPSIRTFPGLLLAALLGFAGARAETLAVTGLEHRQAAGRIVLSLDFTAEPAFSLFTLTDPFRIVIDLPRADWTGPEPDAAAIPDILAVRFGLFRHDTARIVLELARPLAVRRAISRPQAGGGHRLALALEPVAAQDFAAGAGWPEEARWEPGRLPPPPAPGRIVVAIDPGHGGIDPGASRGGLVEKRLVLAFGRQLAEAVERRDGLAAYMTREADVFVPLRERVRLARDAGAHVFVSVHADSLLEGRADGVSLYTLSEEGTDDATRAYAERENRSDVLAGVSLSGAEDDVTRVLVDLARRGTNHESDKLAAALLEALRPRVPLLRTRPHRRGNFVVLKAPDLPSVLVELGFLTSAADRARLSDPEWRTGLAEAIADGLERWIARASPGFLGRAR